MQVDVYTAHHDRSRCFEETVSGPFSVTVFGDWFPRHILGRAYALCAYLRCIIVALNIAWLSFRQGEPHAFCLMHKHMQRTMQALHRTAMTHTCVFMHHTAHARAL